MLIDSIMELAIAVSLLDMRHEFEIEPRKESRWIPVTERPPIEDKRVLVWHSGRRTSEAGFDTDRLCNGKWVRWGNDVTHWMPAPDSAVEAPE